MKLKNKKIKIMSVRLTPEDTKILDYLGKVLDRSGSNTVRIAIRELFKKERELRKDMDLDNLKVPEISMQEDDEVVLIG